MSDFDSMVDDSAMSAPIASNQPTTSSTNDFDAMTDDSAVHETPGEVAKTAAEGAAEGILGPVASYIEKNLFHTKASDIAARKEANPVTHALGQVTGLGASMFTGLGEGALMEQAGKLAGEATGLGKAAEAGSLAAKVGQEAANQAAQMSILQGSDEVSKMILNDPDVTAQSAMANVGMAAALGGVTGAALGAISPLWKSSKSSGAVSKFLEDAKGEWKFRQENGDIVESAVKELQDIHGNMENMRNRGVKSELLDKALPKITEENTNKINSHIQDISDKVSASIQDMKNNLKTKGSAHNIEQDLIDFQQKVTNPSADYINKFKAEDDLKRTLDGYVNYKNLQEIPVFAEQAKKLADFIRPGLENAEIWGGAGELQKIQNSNISKLYDTTKDIMSQFTTKTAAEGSVFNPDKVKTFFNQVEKGKGKVKQGIIENYLKSVEDHINDTNKAFTDKGLEAPFAHTSTSVLSRFTESPTAGRKLIGTLIDKELDKVGGKTAGGAVGSVLGGLLGHPGIGFLAGEHALGPMFTSVLSGLTKTITESPTAAKAFKSTLDFAMAAAKGQKVFNSASVNVFKPGAQVLATHLIPDSASRDKLDRVVTNMQKNPDKMTKLDNGNIGGYLPNHQTSLTKASSQAVQYLQTLKPQPHIISPLDKPVPPQPVEIARYNRALDIAQQPAIVLQHAKDGTLQASDIADIHNMYPALYQQMQQKLTNEMINRHADAEPIPYRTRIGIALFLGQPVDKTMEPESIIAAQPQPKAAPQQGQQPAKGRKGMTSLGKSNKSYMTPSQSSESDRANRD